jgi:hypothetical protein
LITPSPPSHPKPSHYPLCLAFCVPLLPFLLPLPLPLGLALPPAGLDNALNLTRHCGQILTLR